MFCKTNDVIIYFPPPCPDVVDFKGAEEMNPSVHSYELYLHAERSADQNDNKEGESIMLTPSGPAELLQEEEGEDEGGDLEEDEQGGVKLRQRKVRRLKDFL
jgi:hypothetical protein